MDYSINVKNQSIPDLISWAHNVNARNDVKAKDSRDNMMNMLRMVGLAASMGGNNAPAAGAVGENYNAEGFNFNPQEQADLTMLGLNPNLMSKQQLRPNGNIWGNSFGAF